MYTIKRLISGAVDLLTILVLIRILLSFITVDRRQTWVKWVYNITEPLLAPFRKLQQQIGIGGPLDLSPMFLLLAVRFISGIVLGH